MDRASSQSEAKAKKTYKCPYDKCGEVQKSLNGHKKHLGLCFLNLLGMYQFKVPKEKLCNAMDAMKTCNFNTVIHTILFI